MQQVSTELCTDIEIASSLYRFHEYLEASIIQAMYESNPDCCPYCHPEECDTYISPGIKNYMVNGGLMKDIKSFYTPSLADRFRDLLCKQRDIRTFCKKYTGPGVYPFFVLAVNISCEYDKSKELSNFSEDLLNKDIMIPPGTPVILMEYYIRKIHHVWYNALEDVKWLPYTKWKEFGSFHDKNMNLQAVTHRLWDTAMDKLVEQEEEIVYKPPGRLAICA